MGIGVDDTISVVQSEDTWVDFIIRSTAGVPLPGIPLADITLWYAEPDGTSLVSKSVVPGFDLFEVGGGVYRVKLLDSELDTVGLFVLVAEAPGATQTMMVIYVTRMDGDEAGILKDHTVWVPWRGIVGLAATGVLGLTPGGIFYRLASSSTWTAKAITPANLRELGRGIYSIKFSYTEVATLGLFSLRVLATGVDDYLFQTEVVTGSLWAFEFTVEDDDGVPSSGYTIEIRTSTYLDLVGSVVTGVDGKATALLVPDNYIATLVKSSIVFDTNNTDFSVDENEDDNNITLNSEGISTSAPASSSTVTGSATLHDVHDNPLEHKRVVITIRQPTLSGGILFLGSSALETDKNGYVEEEFVPGQLIQVTVEGTNIVREFTVPATNFNLISAALAVADPFTIQTPTFPVAPVHT